MIGRAAVAIDSRAAVNYIVEMRWAAFVAAEAGSDPVARYVATRALAQILGGIPRDGERNVGTEKLVPLLAAIERSIKKLRDDGDRAAEAEMRHELALLLREYAAVLAGKPLRAAVRQGLQALRLLRGTAPSVLTARIHHLIGLAACDAGYADGVRDRERALLHLARARQGFLDLGRRDRAAESVFSAMDAWADRRIGDPTGNFTAVRARWREGRRLFRQAGKPLRALACDISFAQCLFRRRHQRSGALKELVHRLGAVIRALAEIPAYPPAKHARACQLPTALRQRLVPARCDACRSLRPRPLLETRVGVFSCASTFPGCDRLA